MRPVPFEPPLPYMSSDSPIWFRIGVAVWILIWAIFFVFVMPAFFVTGIWDDWSVGLLSLFSYLGFWLMVCSWLLTVTAKLYGFWTPRQLWLFLFWYHPKQDFTKPGIIGIAFGAYGLTVYLFALLYTYLARIRPDSFNVKPLRLFSASYFSLTTICTVGFGDIYPVSTLARTMVMCEILVGLLFIVLVFSILASFAASK